jgi:hypothetical protein
MKTKMKTTSNIVKKFLFRGVKVEVAELNGTFSAHWNDGDNDRVFAPFASADDACEGAKEMINDEKGA